MGCSILNRLTLSVSGVVILATYAFAVPPACTPDAGDCCAESRSPGCNVEACCAEVCECDPFCCDVVWDRACATFGQDARECGAAALCEICMDSDGDGVTDGDDICCDTHAGVSVDEWGRPLGDLDLDCDIDLNDFTVFQRNLRGVTDALGACCVQTPSICGDGSVCTDDSCDPVAGCVNAPVDCDDADVCTVDTCNATTGVCEHADLCDDGYLCTDDSCTDGICENAPVACPSGQACNPASGNCEDIVCGSNADCDDGFGCTADNCNVATGECVSANIDALCDDGLFCTGSAAGDVCDPDDTDARADGCVRDGDPCGGVTPICDEANDECDACGADADCDDGASCTTDNCEAGGNCTNAPVHVLCDDGLFCTADDFCEPDHDDADADGCVNEGDPCELGGAAALGFEFARRLCSEADDGTCVDCTSNSECADEYSCTDDRCDGVSGICTSTSNDDNCDDDLFCTADDFCAPLDADAGADGCVNETDPCAPAKICNEADDECDDCTSNGQCDDGVDCTDDTCNGMTGDCVFTPNDDKCDVAEICDAVRGCVSVP